MKDLQLFTTEHGVASLILKEIPYQGAAYIILRDSLDPMALARECAEKFRVFGLSPREAARMLQNLEAEEKEDV